MKYMKIENIRIKSRLDFKLYFPKSDQKPI